MIAISTEYNWLSPFQFSFRSGKSTNYVNDSIVTTVEENTQKKIFKFMHIFFIKGRFDAAWHPGIMKKLNAESSPAGLLNLMYSYLLCIGVNICAFYSDHVLKVELYPPCYGRLI